MKSLLQQIHKEAVEKHTDIEVPPIPDKPEFMPRKCEGCDKILKPYYLKYPTRSLGDKWCSTSEGLCSECRKKEEEQKQRKLLIEGIIDHSGIPKKFRSVTFESYSPQNDNQIKARSHLKSYELDFDNPKNIYIHGASGLGKTHLIIALCKELVNQHACGFDFRDTVKLLSKIQSSFGKRDYNNDYAYLEYPKKGIYVLDDLGAESTSEWSVKQIYELVNGRYGDELPTFVTSNFSPAELASRTHDRLVSRLMSDGAIIIEIKGRDMRIAANVKRGK